MSTGVRLGQNKTLKRIVKFVHCTNYDLEYFHSYDTILE